MCYNILGGDFIKLIKFNDEETTTCDLPRLPKEYDDLFCGDFDYDLLRELLNSDSKEVIYSMGVSAFPTSCIPRSTPKYSNYVIKALFDIKKKFNFYADIFVSPKVAAYLDYLEFSQEDKLFFNVLKRTGSCIYVAEIPDNLILFVNLSDWDFFKSWPKSSLCGLIVHDFSTEVNA